MNTLFLPALLMSAAPEPCKLPESMPVPSERMAGEGAPGWCLNGIDSLAVGGPDLTPQRQWLVTDDAVDSVTLVQWRRGGADPVPGTWREMFRVAAKATLPGEFKEVLVQRAGDNLIVVTVNPAWRIGNAVCFGEGGPAIGYLPQGATLTEEDRIAIQRIAAPREPTKVTRPDGSPLSPETLAALAEGDSVLDPANVMCTLLTADGDVYRPRFHGPEGRGVFDFDGFYDEKRWQPVPPGDLERHLRINR